VKVFVIARDETGLRSVRVFLESEEADAVRAEVEALDSRRGAVRVLGADLRDVVTSHPSLFEEAA